MNTKKIIKKIMISYIAVWIPILIVCLLVSEISLNGLREREVREIEERIYEVPLELVKQYQGFIENGLAMAKSDELEALMSMANEMNRYLARQYLKEIFRFNVGMYEILLYYGQEELCSVQGTTSLPVYFKQVMSCNDKGYLQASEMLKSDIGGIYYLDSAQGEGYLCYYVPIIKREQPKMSITFVYSFEKVMDAVEQRTGKKLSIFGFSTEGNIMYWEQAGGEFVRCSADRILEIENIKEIVVPIGYGTDKVIKMYYQMNDVIKELSQIQKSNYVLICVGMLATVLITIWVSRRKAVKITRLEENFDINCETMDLQDEYQYLRTLIRNVAQESDLFLRNETTYKRLLLQQTAKVLLHGGVKSREDINFYLRMSGIELCEDYFCLCGYYMESYVEEYEELMIGDLGYYQRLNTGTVYISLLELPNLDHKRENRLKHVSSSVSLLDQGDSPITVMVSRVYDDMIRAREAYEEISQLLQMLEKTRGRKHKEVVFWEDSWTARDEDSCRYPVNQQERTESNAEDDETLAQIVAFINDNYRDCNLSAEAVAEYVGMNKTYLSRLFKQKMRVSYMDYLTELRMRYAKTLLAETDKPISEICVESGYVDPSSFRRKFKQVCGMSVAEYRERCEER